MRFHPIVHLLLGTIYLLMAVMLLAYLFLDPRGALEGLGSWLLALGRLFFVLSLFAGAFICLALACTAIERGIEYFIDRGKPKR
ncbi:MAG: hypothetical protein B7Y80_05065 [Hyphomicrobium sp. 32-62-53]|nr:MAG: hypothetical protein B7Z29_05210 [Hyphomicrobium sp. 12-62-95]OYY01256.1 MAG: hypothetical protein B7Y80_05065 [Hyphomicrobium sp. 32-62-53]